MIGTGDVTEKKSAPSFSKIEGSKLVAVANRTPEKAEDYARRFGIGRWHRDPMDVVKDEEVDIVYVATPPESHAAYALAAIALGKPVYLEKPMARTYAECREINESAARARVQVYVAYYRRSLDYFVKVKELVDSGILGKVLQVDLLQHFPPRDGDDDPDRLPWRLVPAISGGGYFHDMGCHALDVLFYMFGDPVSTRGFATNRGGLYEAHDTVVGAIELEGGIPLAGSWSFVVPGRHATDRITVTGERGRLSFSVFSFEPIRLETDRKSETFSTQQPEHIQLPFIRSIVEELNGRGTCPSTGTTASVTSLVMDTICGVPEI